MNTEELMKLADAYAAAEQHDYLTGEASADHARAIEAALSAKQGEQEPYDKTEMNAFVQNLYDQKMREGKHGHYETMFHVVHQAIKRALPAPSVNAQEANDDLTIAYMSGYGKAKERISELEAQNKALTIQAFEIAVERDELRMELGDLPEAQAEMLGAIKALKVQNAQLLEALKQVTDRFEQSGAYDHDHTVALARAAIAAVEGKI